MSCRCRHVLIYHTFQLNEIFLSLKKKTLKDRICLYSTPPVACLAPGSLVFESNSQLLTSPNGITLPVMCDGIRVTIKHLFVFGKLVHVLRI